jgi:uridine kinase
MTKNKQPLVIGIAGGSGSGKTTVATEILHSVGEEIASYIPHDAYYKDLRELPENQRKAINFDHPNSLDTGLMTEHIRTLIAGKSINLPIYDFTTHTRTEEFIPIPPKPVILVEGILIFTDHDLRNLFDVKLFVDTDSDIRLIRRIRRDISERGRTVESVLDQYEATVRPMHLELTELKRSQAELFPNRNEISISSDQKYLLLQER